MTEKTQKKTSPPDPYAEADPDLHPRGGALQTWREEHAKNLAKKKGIDFIPEGWEP